MTSRYSADDYAGAARALMPRGRVWSQDPNSVQGQALGALGQSMARTDAAAIALLGDAFPAQPVNLLPDWESSLGLPDPCAGLNPTVVQRQNQVQARFVGGGGQSRARFVQFAATLGFTITITTYAPFRVGLDTIGEPIASVAWAFAWGITVLTNTGGLDRAVLACELNAIKPAETTLFFLN